MLLDNLKRKWRLYYKFGGSVGEKRISPSYTNENMNYFPYLQYLT